MGSIHLLNSIVNSFLIGGRHYVIINSTGNKRSQPKDLPLKKKRKEMARWRRKR